MSDFPLYESATAIADANGRAVAQIQPMKAFERWRITRTGVQSTSTTKVPTARLYRGSETPSTFMEGSQSGNLDSTDTGYELRTGERILCVWSNNDVSAACTLTIEGSKTRDV